MSVKCPICLADRGTLGVIRYDDALLAIVQHNKEARGDMNEPPGYEEAMLVMEVRGILLASRLHVVNDDGKFWGWDDPLPLHHGWQRKGE